MDAAELSARSDASEKLPPLRVSTIPEDSTSNLVTVALAVALHPTEPEARGYRWWSGERLRQCGHVARRTYQDRLFSDGSAPSGPSREAEDRQWRGERSERQKYLRLITTCGKKGKCEKAVEVFEEMRRRDLGADVEAYNTVLEACRVGFRWEVAVQLLRDAVNTHGVDPDLQSYNIVLEACEQGVQWKMALTLLDELRARDLKPEATTYTHVVGACAKAQQWKSVLTLLEDMRADSMPYQMISFWREHMAGQLGTLDSWQRWEMHRAGARPLPAGWGQVGKGRPLSIC